MRYSGVFLQLHDGDSDLPRFSDAIFLLRENRMPACFDLPNSFFVNC